MKQKNALWFSRHSPTLEQVAEVEKMGYSLLVLPNITELAAKSLESDEDVAAVAQIVGITARCNQVGAIFGVFATPMLEWMECFTGGKIPCYAAWNVSRPVEGGKPTFQHKRFCKIGQF